MNRRNEQLSSTLQKALQEVLARGLNDPRISGMITITAVKIADDHKTADISVSIYPEEREPLTMHGLQAASRHIRRKAGDLVAVRELPELVFRLDKSLKKQAAVLSAISKAAAEHPPGSGTADVRPNADAGGKGEPTT